MLRSVRSYASSVFRAFSTSGSRRAFPFIKHTSSIICTAARLPAQYYEV